MKLQFAFSLFFLLCAPCYCAKVKNKVSLQWAICDDSPQTVLEKLGISAKEPDKLDPISYYDTKPPVYTPQGLMFRTKVRAGRNISVVKVRFGEEPSEIPSSATCLWDRYGDRLAFVCKKQSPINQTTRLWSDEQVDLAENFWGSIDWDELSEFGPYQNPKWKNLDIQGYDAVFDDVAVLPHHLMEVEVKVPKSDGVAAYRRITEYLENVGVTLCDRQESKTIRLFRALGYFHDDTISPVDASFREAQRPLVQG